MVNNLQFNSIKIEEWRQFRNVEIDFHPRFTVLTGPNGSGKSTLLNLLGLSLSSGPSSEHFLATPVNDKKSGQSGFSLGTLFRKFNIFSRKEDPDFGHIHQNHKIGTLRYSTDESTEIFANETGQIQYNLHLVNRRDILGFKISSHRALPRYQLVTSLPIAGINPREALDYFFQSQSSYQLGGRLHRNGKNIENPIAPLKETLIGFAAFGTDNEDMKAVPELSGLYRRFQEILRNVLPIEIGFERLEVRTPEIVIISKTGEFPIDSASGGLMAIIQTAWQIFLFTKAYGDKAVILIDEPENHLHPSLQRDFMSNLVRTFDGVQFIVATHSPFIISSVKDSRIFALKHIPLSEEKSAHAAVTAQRIDIQNNAPSADKVLSEVLGVTVTIPRWAEAELDRIARNFELSTMTQASIDQLRNELLAAGLSEFFPEAIGRMLRD